jgi:hypothetical protein
VRDNSTIEYETTTSKCPEEMLIEFTLNNKFCFDETSNCSSHMIHGNSSLISELRQNLSLKLEINKERISNLTLVSLILKSLFFVFFDRKMNIK